ncbi:MAG: DCC1-like thiol-disulfide oxidoreductase family protein [Alcanivorax sp.]|nr:DCC1-like thiol-disulfide oxidoreductase family protein [Alcanivorax sp.]
MSGDRQMWLVYDGECPVCQRFSQRVRIRDSVGELHLLDARQPSALLDAITARGLDIDQGMVLVVDQQFYYGADALHALALLGSHVGLFNRFNHWVFRSGRRARLLYPLLRGMRNLLLRLLGTPPINNLKRDDQGRV